MYPYKYCLFYSWLLLLPAALLPAQSRKTPLPLWKDGIYRSVEDFRANRPWLTWKELRGKWFFNPESGITTIAELAHADGRPYPADSIALICLNGQTSLRIPADSTLRSSAVFAALKFPGRISYFTYEAAITDTVSFSAYNPLSGKPFRQARLPRTVREYRERIFILETGEVHTFSAESLVRSMGADPEVSRAVSLIQETEVEVLRKKLLRAIEVFNERNPVDW
ncbi:MAG: hypothetical protein ACOYOO_05545 [Saprospiraceae bacterium]